MDLAMIYQDADNRTTMDQYWISDGLKLVYRGGSSTNQEIYWANVVDN